MGNIFRTSSEFPISQSIVGQCLATAGDTISTFVLKSVPVVDLQISGRYKDPDGIIDVMYFHYPILEFVEIVEIVELQ